MRIVDPAHVEAIANRGDLGIFYNEYFPELREACRCLVAKGCPTIYAVDGITEWRNMWEGGSDPCVMKPVLSHKCAVIGRSQARILESWGNLGKCEVVGVPRFDPLLGRAPRRRGRDVFELLIMTAKTPAFNEAQREAVVASLRDLKAWLASNRRIDGVRIQPRWRLTRSFERAIGVRSELRDTTGRDLADALQRADGVLTTPSTTQLEGMLQGIPVGIIDYSNSPHYVPAAWRITAPSHIPPVLGEFVEAPRARMVYQDYVLHDSLECRTAATPRMVRLVEEMIRIAHDRQAAGEEMRFPARILPDPDLGHHMPEPRFELRELYPEHPDFSDLDRWAIAAELRYQEGRHRREVARYQKRIARLRTPWPKRLTRKLARRFRFSKT